MPGVLISFHKNFTTFPEALYDGQYYEIPQEEEMETNFKTKVAAVMQYLDEVNKSKCKIADTFFSPGVIVFGLAISKL